MNNSVMWRGIAIAALVVMAAAAIGLGAYNQGVAQGIAQSATMAPAAAAEYASHAHGYRSWHGGPIFPLFLLFFLFMVMRGLLWRGPWGGGGWRHRYGHGVPPAFDEWHRRAHEEQPPKA